MRFFIYYLACVLFFSQVSYASDQNLPPLPTLELPGSPTPTKNTDSNLSLQPSDASSNDINHPEDSSSPNQSAGFIDTGDFVLPKIQGANSEDNNLTMPSISSATTTPDKSNATLPEVNTDTLKQDDSNIALDDLPPMKGVINEPSIPVNAVEQPTKTDESPLPVVRNESDSAQPSVPTPVPVEQSPVVVAPKESRGPKDVTSSDAISSEDIEVRTSRGRGRALEVVDKDADQDRLSFVKDESIMLLLEDDDIVLGKLTKQAYLDSLHCKDYINLFLKTYVSKIDEKKTQITDAFIRKYEFLHKGVDSTVLSSRDAKSLAFEAVSRNNIDDLRVLVDNYPILQSYDRDRNNMLMRAIELDNVPISKFLLIRGVDLFGFNRDGESILSISRESGDPIMQQLINDAMFLGRIK